jgi:hypothetical protein
VHGHLFAPRRAEFAGGETSAKGGISDHAALRDYDPEGFLINLLWNARGERQCFQFGPADTQKVAAFLAADRNAQISVITGAWALSLYRAGGSFGALRAEAARLLAREAELVALLRQPQVKARVRILSLSDAVAAPIEPLRTALDEVALRSVRRLAEAPKLADLAGFSGFLQKLRNAGVNPYLTGHFPAEADPLQAEKTGHAAE